MKAVRIGYSARAWAGWMRSCRWGWYPCERVAWLVRWPPDRRWRSPGQPNAWVAASTECEASDVGAWWRSQEHTSELQSLAYLVCRLLLEKKKKKKKLKFKENRKINDYNISNTLYRI